MKVLATLLAVVFVSAAAPPSAPSQIDAILRSPELARSRVGIKIVSLDNGRTIYQRDTDRFFGLASKNLLDRRRACAPGTGFPVSHLRLS